eukprot:169490_1
MPDDTESAWPNAQTLYFDILTSPLFQKLFILGMIAFYLLDVLGCYIYDKYVPKEQQIRMQREQFAGHFISIVHALMIASSATLLIANYLPLDALNANENEILIFQYKCCAVFSGSYFFLDAILIAYYYKQSMLKTISFVVHHFVCLLCMVTVILTAPIMTYLSALNFLIEWSTVILNIRIFARVWSCKYIYFISGWSVIITYPLARVAWNVYMIFISFKSEYLVNYSCPQAPIVLGGAEVFVLLLSAYYYLAIIMASPQKMYMLKKVKSVEKDC